MSKITSRAIRLAARPHGLPAAADFILAMDDLANSPKVSQVDRRWDCAMFMVGIITRDLPI
jgi:hypothetical protein